jgi:TadE-like protein
MSRRRHQARGHGHGGQATVELALVLPLVALVLLALVQAVVVARDQLLVVHAAREAAREAAVDPDPAAATRAAQRAGPLDPARLAVDLSGRAGPGSSVRADVRYRPPNRLPFVGRLLGDLTLSGRATMRVER